MTRRADAEYAIGRVGTPNRVFPVLRLVSRGQECRYGLLLDLVDDLSQPIVLTGGAKLFITHGYFMSSRQAGAIYERYVLVLEDGVFMRRSGKRGRNPQLVRSGNTVQVHRRVNGPEPRWLWICTYRPMPDDVAAEPRAREGRFSRTWRRMVWERGHLLTPLTSRRRHHGHLRHIRDRAN